MTAPLPRDLSDFARRSGYAPTSCPACAAAPRAGSCSRGCANCGGSGRIWSSLRGTLADAGLERLRELLSRASDEAGA